MRALAALLIAAAAPLLAQTFDAASVRRSQSRLFERGQVGVQPGRFVAREASLRDLVTAAYDIRENQVVGAVGWIADERYDVTATLPDGAALATVRPRLRALLAERFALMAHREMRTLAVYTMRLARAGVLGPRLRPSGPQCAPPVPPPGVPPPPMPPPPADVPLTPLSGAPAPRCPTMFFTGMVSSRAMPIVSLVERLARLTGRPVVDESGLRGEYDIDLYYQTGVSAGGDTGVDGSAPALLPAVREQLGLTLEAGSAPVEVLVIDAAQRPSEP